MTLSEIQHHLASERTLNVEDTKNSNVSPTNLHFSAQSVAVISLELAHSLISCRSKSLICVPLIISCLLLIHFNVNFHKV